MGLTGRVLTGLGVGLASGFVLATLGGAWTEAAIRALWPVGQIWINLIRMTVIPLVVSLLFVSVASTSDLRAVGRIGGRAALVFLTSVAAVAAAVTVLAAPLLRSLTIDPGATAALRESAGLDNASVGQATRIPSFAEWLVGLVPVNPIASAAEGALLPLILFTIAAGLAATRISDEQRHSLTMFFTGAGEAMLVLVRWALVAAPVGVFALAVPLGAHMGLTTAGALVYYVGLVALFCSGIIIVLYPIGAVLGRIPLRRLARGLAPAQGVAFGSRSSLAALPVMIREATSTLNLAPSASSLFLPLAVSVFRITAPVGMIIGVLFLARIYGVEVGGQQLVAVALLSAVLSFSVPGIPGGSIIVMVPTLVAAGVPIEGIGLLLAIDTVPDMFRTTGNVTAHLALAGAVGRESSPTLDPDLGPVSHEVSSLPVQTGPGRNRDTPRAAAHPG